MKLFLSNTKLYRMNVLDVFFYKLYRKQYMRYTKNILCITEYLTSRNKDQQLAIIIFILLTIIY